MNIDFEKLIKDISTKGLEQELEKRKDRNLGCCPTCGGKWTIYIGCSRSWRREQHCFGCRKPIENCIC